jgi:hypothetical protein
MLGSQLAALEWPADASVIDVSRSFDAVCADVVSHIRGIAMGSRGPHGHFTTKMA